MIPLKKFRQLDLAFEHLDDVELEAIRSEMYEYAQLMFEVWWLAKNRSKNPLGSFSNQKDERTISI